jgi:hypothetical protein
MLKCKLTIVQITRNPDAHLRSLMTSWLRDFYSARKLIREAGRFSSGQ